MGLLSDLGDGPVALDTAVFIYLVEEATTRKCWLDCQTTAARMTVSTKVVTAVARQPV